MDWLSDLVRNAVDFTPAGLLFIAVVMYQRGEFVSKREHQETRADRDLARAESQQKDLVIRELVQQNAELLSGGKVAVEVSRALPHVITSRRQEVGDSDDD